MIYFTSDLHFDHKTIIPFYKRPFKDSRDMNMQLIRNINNTVNENDELYILGDFCVNDENMLLTKTFKYARLINCKHIHLLKGNHDANVDELKNYNRDNKVFDSISSYEEIEYKNIKIILCHYPFVNNGWNCSEYGSLHLHGHIHSKGDYNSNNKNNSIYKYDVGVDSNNFSPISIEKIFDFFKIDI